ncbi:MAG TPA: MFS transporter [Hypericibacter adhaerens]|jgi:MFS family permease|uniref:MFS transporter n=1 Tax=Hypericibacter adhaerens TaxID=2602016 RepID=A0A5J6N4K5_9PROT|nr:MFS transporter [Hypericibacter adhaerens]QEX23855.1 MFS transporter [Hypericibacter adhaerens]HWA43115.1 MFS transporter [Hypericibacter adhaerens]
MTFAAPAWIREFGKPGAATFALMFAIDSLARASLTTVIPLVALRTLGNARDVSLLYTVTGWTAVAVSFVIPWIVRRYRPRRLYSLGAAILVVAPLLLATQTLWGLAAAMALRAFAAACLLNGLNLYTMAYIKKQDFVRSEPLRAFFAAACWAFGPSLGIILYDRVGPWATYLLSSSSAVLLLVYFRRMRAEHGPALPMNARISTNPIANIRRYVSQPRLRLAWVLSFGREVWWSTFYVYGPVYLVAVGRSDTAVALVMTACTAMLFASPLMGWVGRQLGARRHLIAAFLAGATATLGVAVFFDFPWWATLCLGASALAAVALDSVVSVPFLRAVKARERPEMTMVFSMYRDLAGLLPPMLFSLLLTFFDLHSVFISVGIFMIYCAWLARWVPRGM